MQVPRLSTNWKGDHVTGPGLGGLDVTARPLSDVLVLKFERPGPGWQEVLLQQFPSSCQLLLLLEPNSDRLVRL